MSYAKPMTIDLKVAKGLQMVRSPQAHIALNSLLLVVLSTAVVSAAEAPVDYNRQIRPILSNNCLMCHGPDAAERQAGLMLHLRESAIGTAESGKRAIVPTRPDQSELVRRIHSPDADVQMPPPDSKKTLTAEEKALLARWIAEGAKYQTHWAFLPPVRPAVPEVKLANWPRSPLDRFILARLEREKLSHSLQAEKTTLIRRLTLDLTGMPPTLAEIDAFLTDDRPDAYERLADRLFASPLFGERLAVDWLDAARFADTHGYHIDSGRDMNRWREYVIECFNRDVPYDQFILEQVAGDLLPETGDAELDLRQKIASGFNRNHMINFEGGAIPQEYLNAYIVDRVNTTSTVFLGLTVACCQCHDHKFDPISQREFYQLYAFFNNVPEVGLDGRTGNAVPLIKTPTPEQEKETEKLAAEIAAAEAKLATAKAATESGEEGKAEQKKLTEEIGALKMRQTDLDRLIPSTMVMQELPQPRDTFLLVRGAYDKPGDKVTADVPSFLPSLPEGSPNNRLGLARWLIDDEHPLTARVTVNRYWQLLFGTGIVKTAEDFGSQGELPSHPELLDWLAVEFRDMHNGWQVKRLIRQLVNSATYRQSSAVSESLVAKDPENRLLARAPRFRLQAEFLRDQALFISGLYDGRIGGHSVSPYQPAGLWEELMSRSDGAKWTAQKYEQSHGIDLYRRTMYTFWKRTSPPPSLATFDAPDRETCTVRRSRTNTPLQALVMMNDPTYIEASRKFAERILSEGGTTTDERLVFAFRSITARKPIAAELAVLRTVYEKQLSRFRAFPDAATSLLRIGESPAAPNFDPAELAAWAITASTILNTDEAVTRG